MATKQPLKRRLSEFANVQASGSGGLRGSSCHGLPSLRMRISREAEAEA